MQVKDSNDKLFELKPLTQIVVLKSDKNNYGVKSMQIKQTKALDSQIYADAIAVRKEVFVKEQGISVADELENEAGPLYFVGYKDSIPVCTARVFEEENGIFHIQRVAVKKEYRRQGLAKKLLLEVEKSVLAKKLTLNSQETAVPFYEALGYKITSSSFLDVGIVHYRMDKVIF